MKFKFSISMFLIMIIIIFIGNVVQAADENAKIGMSKYIDEEKNIIITLSATNVTVFEGTLSYDSDMIEYVNHNGKNDWTVNIGRDTMKLGAISSNVNNEEFKEVVTITFKIKDTSDSFSTNISLKNIRMKKTNGEDVSATGDLDLNVKYNNGKLNEDDVLYTDVKAGNLLDENGKEVEESVLNYEQTKNLKSAGNPSEANGSVALGDLNFESVDGETGASFGDAESIVQQDEGEKIELTEEEIELLNKYANKKVSENNTEDNNNENNSEQKNTEKSNTLANKILPKTGYLKVVLPIVIGVGLIVIAIVVLNKSKKTK